MIGGSRPLGAIVGEINIPVGGRREPIGEVEVRFAQERRFTVRASWQAVAEMLQRPIHDVRMAADPEYRARHATRQTAGAR